MRCTNYGASYFSTKWDPSSLPCQSRLARTRMASGLADRQVVGGWRGQSSRSVGQKEDLDDCGNRGVRLAVVVEKRTGGCVCGETAARREDESKEGRASAAAGSGAEACPKQQAARQAGGRRSAAPGCGQKAEWRRAPGAGVHASTPAWPRERPTAEIHHTDIGHGLARSAPRNRRRRRRRRRAIDVSALSSNRSAVRRR